MGLRVAFHTLGCKLNQLETESFADAFSRSGAEVRQLEQEDGAAADLVIINTCTVTSKAEQKARRIVRLALAAKPSAVALITGCYAEVEAEALSSLDPRALVLAGSRKSELLALPEHLKSLGFGPVPEPAPQAELLESLKAWLASKSTPSPSVPETTASDSEGSGGRFAYNPRAFTFHSRPSLKIQDGCDNACTYCRVHIARGRASSLASEEILRRARDLEAAGKAEIVLAGVNLAQYRDGDRDFPGLLRLLLQGTQSIAFRISSYEPDRIDEAFLEVFSDRRIRPHVHLALQSGSDRILASMGRHYNRAQVFAAVEALRKIRGDPFLATDIIAGFPGESEQDAQDTLDLTNSCGFAWIHAFRFSPRPGTPAYSMPGRVPEAVASLRVEALGEAARRGKAFFTSRAVGTEVRAVLERGELATSENYLKLNIRDLPEGLLPGYPILCRIDSANHDEALAADACAVYISRDYVLYH